jgi:hypothetical protein
MGIGVLAAFLAIRGSLLYVILLILVFTNPQYCAASPLLDRCLAIGLALVRFVRARRYRREIKFARMEPVSLSGQTYRSLVPAPRSRLKSAYIAIVNLFGI